MHHYFADLKRIFQRDVTSYITVFLRWLLLSSLIGLLGGFIGTAFYKAIVYVTIIRMTNPWLIYWLPFAGVVIVFAYHIARLRRDPGTNIVIESIVDAHHSVPIRMAFLIFGGTVITHLFGGSVGRESAALQIGGCVGSGVGKMLKLDERSQKLITMCGMSALFSAVFGTPVTATVFVIEFISVGIMHYSALVPCLLAAYIARLIAASFGIQAETYLIAETVSFGYVTCLKVLALGAVCAVVGILFCLALHSAAHFLRRYGYNDYIRILGGGMTVMCLTVLVGNYNYNGAGAHIIEEAIAGHAVWYAFLVKILFTAITLGAGYKGGEIVPSFFIGATMGCVTGPLLGLPASVGAGLGLIGVFCAVVNCPLASIILSVELFGSENLVLFAIVCVVSYMLSGPFSLYSSQRIQYSKLRPEFVHQKTM